MATLATTKPGTERNILQNLLGPALGAVRPVAKDKAVTIFRPIPEVAHDGSLLPMVRSMTPSGPDFSNVTVETCSVGVGEREDAKATVVGRPSDVSIDRATHMIFPGLYIRLKAMDKKGTIPDHMYRRVNELLKPNEKGFSRLSRPQDLAIMQGVVLQVNNQALPKPAPRQAVFLSATARDAVASVLNQAHEQGIDVFDPEEGYCIEISSIPPGEGRATASFTAKLGSQMRIPEEQCRQLWTPWDLGYDAGSPDESIASRGARLSRNEDNAKRQGLKLLTLDEHIELAVRCFDEELVAMVFPEYFKDRTRTPRPAPQPVAATKPAAPAASQKPAGKLTLEVDTSAAPAVIEESDGGVTTLRPAADLKVPAPAAPVTSGAPSPAELQAQIAALLAMQQQLKK